MGKSVKVLSPGRINLIGEHTDYNDGYVLPFAINRYIKFVVEESDRFDFFSLQYGKGIQLEKLVKTNSWADYLIGVIIAMKNKGLKINPVSVKIDSNLPSGAGLSSSAALEVGFAQALNTIFDLNLSNEELAIIGHEAESQFVGVRCGIMDQYVVALAKKDHALFLDTMTREYKHISLNIDGLKIFLINSGVKHELGNSEYNLRREQCENVLKVLGIGSFRNMAIEDLEKIDDVTLRKRAKHVLEENERVLKSLTALETGNVSLLGELLFQSHYSLKDLYEVSCEEIDFLVDELSKKKSVLGARMVGGGFGGGVIVLAGQEFKNEFPAIAEKYRAKYSINPELLEVESSEGVSVVK